ncbi:uncharacterized protein LOC105844729 [Hydra vulgaris]|uniref:uncharacterized protein LOC105844729 n=1 Tax=Hydra vulgaris TaxID=6087 RepID=UPI000640BFCE|nr:uncharacterized protein LOC105844729 [Hydra vulgaris]XP_047130533.1 uncharacterized protein LOC105844729 [Hydra vulgaris]
MDEKFQYEVLGIIQKNEMYVRFKTACHFVALEFYRKIFHDPCYAGFSKEGSHLYNELQAFKGCLSRLKGNVLNNREWSFLFPENQQTLSETFTLNLIRTIIRYCVCDVNNSADIFALSKYADNLSEEGKRLLTVVENIHATVSDKKTKELILSDNGSKMLWQLLNQALDEINFDQSEIEKIKHADLDLYQDFRLSLITSQFEVLLDECNDILKSVSLNYLAVEKLIEDCNNILFKDKNGLIEKDFFSNADKVLSEASSITDKLNFIKQTIIESIIEIPDWKEKNLEGDIIIIDEKLVNLKNDTIKQTKLIKNVFHVTSLSMVKIKETYFFQENKAKILNQMRSISSGSIRDIRVL